MVGVEDTLDNNLCAEKELFGLQRGARGWSTLGLCLTRSDWARNLLASGVSRLTSEQAGAKSDGFLTLDSGR